MVTSVVQVSDNGSSAQTAAGELMQSGQILDVFWKENMWIFWKIEQGV